MSTDEMPGRGQFWPRWRRKGEPETFVAEVKWHPVPDKWTAYAQVHTKDGQLVVRSLHLVPHDSFTPDAVPGRGIGQTVLREVHIAPILQLLPERRRWYKTKRAEPWLDLLLQKPSVPKPSGRTTYDDGFLRRVALAYLVEAREGRGVRGRLLKRPEFAALAGSEETVRDWVHAARARGWLGPGAPGRVGAEPGERLLAEERQRQKLEKEADK